MKVKPIFIPGIKTIEDYEFIAFDYDQKQKIVFYHTNDKTYWNLYLRGIIEFKFIFNKNYETSNLSHNEGILFEVLESVWIEGFEKRFQINLDSHKHFILIFKNCNVECIAQELIFEKI